MKVCLTKEERNLIFKVIDTGTGIREEDKGKLFQFFGKLQETNNINQSGMGLGLTISKLIIQKLGGEISFESVFR